MRIAINGAGIAGPTLAYWLLQSGHEVLLVEEAPHLRTGGYVIDFWGVGYDIAEKMGLLPQIREAGYQVQEVRFVDSQGRRTGGFPVSVLGHITKGRFTSVRRSDVARIVHDALRGEVETLFGDSIARIVDDGQCVRVDFDRASPREFDLVVGADGLHSRIRRLAFGDQADFEVRLGYHVAAFEVAGYRPRDELVYLTHGMPGRQISRFSLRDDRTLFLLVFRDDFLPAQASCGANAGRAVLKSVFGDIGWEGPRVLAAMDDAEDVYFDRVSQVRMNRWAKGRIALVGDAAACVSLLAGEGTGLAMAEAYVLAGELDASGHDHVAAFARYQGRLMPLLARKQHAAAKFASAFVPKSAAGLAFRGLVSRLLGVPVIADFFIGRGLRDDIVLPVYRS